MKLTRLNQILDGGRVVKGSWEINNKHEIYYRGEGKDEEFRLKAALLGAEPDALLLAVTERQSQQKIVTQILKLGGAWRLDAKNRVVFEAEREKGASDVLTFNGSWEIGPSNQILYTYEEKNLKTKSNRIRTVAFKGHWDVGDDRRLAYHIGRDSNSVFRIRGAFQTASILAKKGEIRYQVGVEVLRKRKSREIILFGKWKISRDLGLSFEVEYENGRKGAIGFGAEYAITKNNTLSLSLKNEKGKTATIELVLTRDFLEGDGQAFARALKSERESRAEIGAKFSW